MHDPDPGDRVVETISTTCHWPGSGTSRCSLLHCLQTRPGCPRVSSHLPSPSRGLLTWASVQLAAALDAPRPPAALAAGKSGARLPMKALMPSAPSLVQAQATMLA